MKQDSWNTLLKSWSWYCSTALTVSCKIQPCARWLLSCFICQLEDWVDGSWTDLSVVLLLHLHSLSCHWGWVILHLWKYVRKWKSMHDYYIKRVGSGPSLVWIRELNQNGSSRHVKKTHLNESLSLQSRNASCVWRSMLREGCWGSQGAKEWASGNALHVKTLHESVINVAALSSTCQEPSSLKTMLVLLPGWFHTGGGIDEQ